MYLVMHRTAEQLYWLFVLKYRYEDVDDRERLCLRQHVLRKSINDCSLKLLNSSGLVSAVPTTATIFFPLQRMATCGGQQQKKTLGTNCFLVRGIKIFDWCVDQLLLQHCSPTDVFHKHSLCSRTHSRRVLA